jgi:hypothetical protein
MATLNNSKSVVVPETASANGSKTALLKTDFLIVGAGPAGGTLGCFLGFHGKLEMPFHCGSSLIICRPKGHDNKRESINR